jgi:hypothetical protein
VPTLVKQRYSPQQAWRDRPFLAEDVRFFFRGIRELSEMFTEDRYQPAGRRVIQYFNHPRFRSAYLLYFLPLQAAKFISLFQIHSEAFEAALKHARKSGVLRIADIGAGPGTASIAFLMMLIGLDKNRAGIRRVELEWFDENRHVLEDGRAIIEGLAGELSSRGITVSLKTVVAPLRKAVSLAGGDMSLIMMGNVLNELYKSRRLDSEIMAAPFELLMKKACGGGILMVEPAIPDTAQDLADLRDHLLESGWLVDGPSAIHGPCLHAGPCPLRTGRDWCHFSVPVSVPGGLFRQFSGKLGSERQWAKFSYLWLASAETPAGVRNPLLRRVISDPLRGQTTQVLLCEPGRPMRFGDYLCIRLRRGELVLLAGESGASVQLENTPST